MALNDVCCKTGFFSRASSFRGFRGQNLDRENKKPRKLGMVRALVNTTMLKVTSALFIHSSSFLLENRMFVTVFTWNVVILKYVPSDYILSSTLYRENKKNREKRKRKQP